MSVWNSQDTEFLLRNWRGMSDAEIGKHVGDRSPSAVKERRRLLGIYRSSPRGGQDRDFDAQIVEMWPTRSAYFISRHLGCTHNFVLNAAERLGLPRRTRGESIALGAPVSNFLSKGAPRKPRGFADWQMDWAMENPDHPEAKLIAGMAGEGVLHVSNE